MQCGVPRVGGSTIAALPTPTLNAPIVAKIRQGFNVNKKDFAAVRHGFAAVRQLGQGCCPFCCGAALALTVSGNAAVQRCGAALALTDRDPDFEDRVKRRTGLLLPLD